MLSAQGVHTSGRTLDYAAGVYDWLSPLMTFGQERRFCGKIIELLELKGNERILDVGCGTGTLSIEIAGKLSGMEGSSLVVGLDAAPKMIQVARRKSEKIQAVRFDLGIAEALPYEDAYFNRVVSGFFFHHINYLLKKRSLEEMCRVLKKNGTALIIDVDVPENLLGRLCAWSGYFLFHQEEIRENIRGKLREALNGAPFSGCERMAVYQGYIGLYRLIK